MMIPDRRRFLLGSSSALAIGSLPVGAALAANRTRSATGLVLYREANEASRYFAAAMSRAGMGAIALTDDLVRQWRSELNQILRDNPLPLYGLTDWSDYQLLRGLAVELRRFPQQELRLTVPVSGQPDWAVNQALATLDDAVAEPKSTTDGQALFNWVIS